MVTDYQPRGTPDSRVMENTETRGQRGGLGCLPVFYKEQ